MEKEEAGGLDIAVLAERAGVSSRTLRYYGELGLIRAAGRGPGGRRRYDSDALERLRFIERLKALGLTLEEIARLNDAFERGATAGMLDELERLLQRHLGTLTERIAQLRRLESDMETYLERIRRKRAALDRKQSA